MTEEYDISKGSLQGTPEGIDFSKLSLPHGNLQGTLSEVPQQTQYNNITVKDVKEFYVEWMNYYTTIDPRHDIAEMYAKLIKEFDDNESK